MGQKLSEYIDDDFFPFGEFSYNGRKLKTLSLGELECIYKTPICSQTRYDGVLSGKGLAIYKCLERARQRDSGDNKIEYKWCKYCSDVKPRKLFVGYGQSNICLNCNAKYDNEEKKKLREKEKESNKIEKDMGDDDE